MARSIVLNRLAGVLACTLLVAACSGGDGDESVAAETDTSAATSTPGAAAGATDTTVAAAAGDATTATTVADGGQVQTQPDGPAPAPVPTPGQAGGAATPSPATPARPIVPRAGTYTFERTTTDAEGTETDTSDSLIERLSGDDSAGRVRLTVESEQGAMASEADVSDAGTLVDLSVIDSPLGEINCNWEPNWYLLGAFAPGSTWSFDSSCHDAKGALTVDVHISGTGTIVGSEQIQVAGQTVNAWIVDTTTVTEFTVKSPTLNGTQRSEAAGRSWVDPGLGMQVRSQTSTKSAGDFANGDSTINSEFVRFTAA